MRELTCTHMPAERRCAGRAARTSSGSTAIASSRSSRPSPARPAPAGAAGARPTPTITPASRSTTAYGGAGKPLETWIAYLALLPSVDPYLAAAVSLSRSALGGAGAVMVHYTRVQGLTDLPTEVAEVARAARDVGVRVGFAVAMRNRNPLVYGPSEPILAALSPQARARKSRSGSSARRRCPVEQQIALVDAVAERRGQSDVRRAIWPAGGAMVHARAARSDCATPRSAPAAASTCICWRPAPSAPGSTPTIRGGILKFLDGIGLLSPRLTLAHCTWARPDELELIAERGATISVNTSSNLHLRSGIAPLKEMVKRGCRVALGLDGSTFDEDDDALREMRLAHLLHQGIGFRHRRRPPAMLRMAFHNGRLSVTNRDDGGALAPGDAGRHPGARLGCGRSRAAARRISIRSDLLFARTTMRHIHELIVAGRTVVRDGEVLGIDYPAMRDDMLARLARRHGAATPRFAAALGELERVVRRALSSPKPPCC